MKVSTLIYGLLATMVSAMPTPAEDAEPTIEGIELLQQAQVQASSNDVAKRYTSGDTANDLGGACRAITVIFARGTTESGNVGSIVGPPFLQALNSRLGANNIAAQGVNYPATVAGYLAGGDRGGAATLASLTNQAASKCPNTKIVLSGYSQGAQVVHLGAALLFQSVANRVAAVVLFGDPDNGQPFARIPANKVDTFCAAGDLICAGQPVVLPPHLSYGANAGQAAAFVDART
ncbi:MAG: hypothetical protein Q9160_002179 [Pyrenula sp. 1 TL-2023]